MGSIWLCYWGKSRRTSDVCQNSRLYDNTTERDIKVANTVCIMANSNSISSSWHTRLTDLSCHVTRVVSSRMECGPNSNWIFFNILRILFISMLFTFWLGIFVLYLLPVCCNGLVIGFVILSVYDKNCKLASQVFVAVTANQFIRERFTEQLVIATLLSVEQRTYITRFKPKFHLARHDSTRSTCRTHAFWLCRASRTAQLDSLDTTNSTRRTRLARHDELDRRDLQLSYDHRNSFIV